MEKLDSFNKILLATGNINYLASMVDGVNSDIKRINDPEKVHEGGIERREKAMEAALYHLKEAMEVLGNSMDYACAIDQYITTPALQVLIHGHDEVEGDFDEL